jgi:predicted RecA/RadA family phage recombinase
MATVTFVHDGEAIDYTPAADVAAGAVVVQGELVGVAKQPIAANKLGALGDCGRGAVLLGRDQPAGDHHGDGQQAHRQVRQGRG